MSYDDRYDRPRPYRQPEPKGSPHAQAVLLLLGVIGLIGLAVWGYRSYTQPRDDSADREKYGTLRVPVAAGPKTDEEQATIDLYKAVSPSVVHITSLDLRRDGLNLDVMKVPRGTGSGFVWDDGGHIVTNYHVVKGAGAASVTFADKDHSTYPARLVGAYPSKDIAVLKVDAPKDKLKPIVLGTSADLQVGQKTFAIGNPFGLDQSLTRGIVSALGREIDSDEPGRPIKNVIQTDAAINPGNSGGPLLDSHGRLIGVNTAIYSPSGAFAGIGFAIPVDEVNQVVAQLIKNGKVTRPGLGISILSDDQARRAGVDGVVINAVLPDGPAKKADLKGLWYERNRPRLGDVIVAIDDRPVKTNKDLFTALNERKVGDTVRVKVRRSGGEEEVVEVTLGEVE